jgi:uncharacterized protein (TIGR00251 family)
MSGMSGMSGANAVHLEATADGAWVEVRAVPGASRDRIAGILGDALKVCVSAAPEKGKANKRIAAVLAGCLGVARRDVRVVGGATSRDKRVLILGLSTTELRVRLAQALQSDL